MTRRAVAVLVLVAALTGCGDEPSPAAVEGTSVVESGPPCPVPSALPSAPPVPAGLPLPAGSEVTAYGTAAGTPALTGRVDAPVEQVLAHFRAAVEQAGFVVQRDEDEGRAGELGFFGARGDGTVTVSRLTCPRGVTGFTVLSGAPPGQPEQE